MQQFCGINGTSTTGVLVEIVHLSYKATDKLGSYVRVVMQDLSKAFDLINHHSLVETLHMYGWPSHIVRLMATFSVGRNSTSKNWRYIFPFWSSQGGSTGRNIVWT